MTKVTICCATAFATAAVLTWYLVCLAIRTSLFQRETSVGSDVVVAALLLGTVGITAAVAGALLDRGHAPRSGMPAMLLVANAGLTAIFVALVALGKLIAAGG